MVRTEAHKLPPQLARQKLLVVQENASGTEPSQTNQAMLKKALNHSMDSTGVALLKMS